MAEGLAGQQKNPEIAVITLTPAHHLIWLQPPLTSWFQQETENVTWIISIYYWMCYRGALIVHSSSV